MTNLIISKRRDNCGVKAEAFPETTNDVILSAAFPCTELSCGSDSALTRIQTKHNLAERSGIVLALTCWS